MVWVDVAECDDSNNATRGDHGDEDETNFLVGESNFADDDSRCNRSSHEIGRSGMESGSSLPQRSNPLRDIGRDRETRDNSAPPRDRNSRTVLVAGHRPGRRAGHTATAVGRKIYVFGGTCGSDFPADFVLDTSPHFPEQCVMEPKLVAVPDVCHFSSSSELPHVSFLLKDGKYRLYGHKIVLSDCFRDVFTTGSPGPDPIERRQAWKRWVPFSCRYWPRRREKRQETDSNEYNNATSSVPHRLPEVRDLAPVLCDSSSSGGQVSLLGADTAIPDCTYDAFSATIEYMRSGVLRAEPPVLENPDQGKNRSLLKEILELSDRLMLDHLKQTCLFMLEEQVTKASAKALSPVEIQARCELLKDMVDPSVESVEIQ
jgi:Kelch motif